MSKIHQFSAQAVRQMLPKDRILSFRYKLLIEKENKSEDEALYNLYDNLIMEDPFRFSTYKKELSKLTT